MARIHKRRNTMNDSKISNRLSQSYVGNQNLINSPSNKEPSEKSFNYNLANLELGDTSAEKIIQNVQNSSLYVEEKEFAKSIPESMTDVATLATKRGKYLSLHRFKIVKLTVIFGAIRKSTNLDTPNFLIL